ncbi:sulfotransferase [Kordiimonas sp.]|uniref:sulfotransferase n=1 Tax=Kordiimonas sp. TaxID=1970157 RepID=UPI003A94DE4B
MSGVASPVVDQLGSGSALAEALPPMGVVIPAFGHSRFLGEAIISACGQETERPIYVVVVDDGCRLQETATTVNNLMHEYPGKLFYLRQKNTRLPGARNTGVRFLLDVVPDIDAIFFLDADNRLSPFSLEAYRKALGDDETVGWAYPDISFFGLSWGRGGFDTRETAPDYSVLKHLNGNISEAGSLVRAGMFRDGVFYDETMRFGFEDWDFWLGALQAGYRGVRVADAGFLYRRRAESMLADSRRDEDFLLEHMKSKHKALYEPDSLMRALHDEAPTFAVLCNDRDDVLLFADPDAVPHAMSHSAFCNRLVQCRVSPREHFFPEKIVLCSSTIWDALYAGARPYLRWFFWQLLRQSGDINAVTFHHGVGVEWLGTAPAAHTHMVVVGGRRFEQMAWNDQDETLPAVQALPHAVAAFPVQNMPDPAALDITGMMTSITAQLPRGATWLRHADRRYAGPDARMLYKNIVVPACSADEEYYPPVPWVKAPGEKWCAFLVNEHNRAYGGLNRRLSQMRAKGYKILLIAERQQGVAPSPHMAELMSCVDMVVPVVLEHAAGTGRFYLGRSVPSVMTPLRQLEIETLAVHFDLLIADFGSTGVEAFGAVRHRRAKTHLLLPSSLIASRVMEDYGRLLAYEHAIDTVVTDNVGQVSAVLAAQGLPTEKVADEDHFFSALPPCSHKSPSPAVMAKPLNWQPRDGYVFIVTYGRSGSTLLQRILQSVDGYFMRGENENTLYSVYTAWQRAAGMRQRFDTRRKVPPHGPWYGADEVDADAFAARMIDAFVAEVIRPPEDARLVGFKEIRYGDLTEDDLYGFLQFMKRFFPRARFIFNMRRWQGVAKSSWWRDMEPDYVQNFVTRSDEVFTRFASDNPDQSCLLRYEDYAGNAAGLSKMFEFLGEPMNVDMVASLMAHKLKH